MTIGERIRYYRKMIGMTQEELASKVGVAKQAINKYETGRVTNIPIERFQAMAEVLGVSPAVLMGRQEDPSSEEDLRDMLKDNPKLRMLLSASAKLNEADIDQLYRIASLMGKE